MKTVLQPYPLSKSELTGIMESVKAALKNKRKWGEFLSVPLPDPNGVLEFSRDLLESMMNVHVNTGDGSLAPYLQKPLVEALVNHDVAFFVRLGEKLKQKSRVPNQLDFFLVYHWMGHDQNNIHKWNHFNWWRNFRPKVISKIPALCCCTDEAIDAIFRFHFKHLKTTDQLAAMRKCRWRLKLKKVNRPFIHALLVGEELKFKKDFEIPESLGGQFKT